ncbi:putative N-acetylmuramoyl-L-alanine amidase [Calothrix sp. NIES-4071]|nr:putative N-acetylmuramoyl-L-alanine amidase [Calothrix sp. NIES-4071]BAZ59814.1 putative N-acetylmuramoyl-L-alanine amidase [Calothrix sp. NIES-4105]
MESIAYIHLASAYEAPEFVEVTNIRFGLASWRGKLSFNAMMKFLPVMLSLFVVSIAEQSLAVSRGTSGGEVRSVQQCLRQLGYFRGPITGNFGSQTQDAVTRFQRANGLPAVGSVGPRTQQLLRSQCNAGGSSSGSGVLRLGSRGQAVSNLQSNLSRLRFFNGPINGTFGPQTQDAVIRFQQANGLRADGVVGAGTLQAIRNAATNYGGGPDIGTGIGGDNPPLNQGDTGFLVRRLQEDLRQLGFFPVNPTGTFGPTTRDAVANFQRSNGIIPTGVADSQTLALISQTLINSGNQGSSWNNNPCSSERGEICLGERSQRVIIVQQRLQQWGVYGGNADGVYGSATRDAVAQFQRTRGLAPTGFVDFNTWQALGLNNNQTPPIGQQPQNNNRYVVVIPIFANDTLNRVRQVLPQAFAAKSGLGDYVNAGSFSQRSDAERLTSQLRDRGFDARVEFF